MELEALLNIGPKSAERLRYVGIPDLDTLERVGIVEAYQRVKSAFPHQTSVNMLYALQGALLGIPWQELPDSIKSDLLGALDT